jgi:hypothetical protein
MKKFFSHTMVLMVLCAAVCSSAQAAGQTVQISRLAVMPLAEGVPAPAKESTLSLLDCKETDLTSDGQTINPGAGDIVTGCLQKAMEKELSDRVVPQNETAGAEELLAYMK